MRPLFQSLLVLLAGAFIARADANVGRTAPPPVLPGLNADPNIAVFGDTFYIYPTTDGYEGWRSTSFRAWSSRDLVHWKNEGVILDLPRDLTWAGGHAWAPAIATKNGKYYFYYCADQNIGVAVGDSPVGPFKDPLGRPLVAKRDFQGMQAIDPMVFVDDDGSAYLYWGQGRCKVVKLNDDMISFNMADVRDLTLPGYNEGPFVHKRKGTFYLSWSEFDTRDPRYSVAYATGDSPLGPFTKAATNPILHGSGPVKGAGHHSIVQIPGRDEWVIAYHRFRIPDGNGYNRETCLSPLRYAEDGSILPVDVFESVSLKDSALVTSNISRLPGDASSAGINLAPVATPSASYVSGDTSVAALNDNDMPRNSLERGAGAYGNWPRQGTQWVQYEWPQPISTKRMEVYWWDDHRGVRLPKSCRVKFWNGNQFVEITNATGPGVDADKFNVTTFGEVTTTKLRLEMDGAENFSTGILEWRVLDSGKSPEFPPKVDAGVDRDVMLGGKTYLAGTVKFFKPDASSKISWSKDSGPGEVSFADAHKRVTTATFSQPGDYVLRLTAGEEAASASSTLKVKVATPPPAQRLDVVYTRPYQINSPLWNAKAKALIVNWIPHCIDEINRTNIPANQGDGGIDNFIEAARALRGEPHGPHKGYVFANAWVHQTVEAMCIALMVDPQGDKDIIAAQAKMKATLEDWIPKILAAQEPDGYLQTAYTLADRKRWPSRWNPAQRGNHEGYVAGYFIESAINDYTITGGTDKRLYNAAKKLADCWVANIGPGKKEWYDGHEEMEQALVRFGRFVNDVEGNGRGDSYIALAKFLLDCRGRHGGGEYDQTQAPVQQQYEAVGHAVRAAYLFSGMADVAAETHDVDYQSAVMSLWDNLINKKYHVTGGIGSGETSEGFGGNYSLPNEAYCESCSSCGEIFFQWKMNLAYHDARYADLYEETMYNALLGSTDLEGKHFYYDNPLVEDKPRYPWHVCPCCVGNIPRTLLMIPTWTYVKSGDGIYVNLFIGSTIKVERVAGTDVEMVQQTDYPWSGKVSITVNPKQSKEFTVFVRVPDRTTSELYTSSPEVNGLQSIAVNGQKVSPRIANGYAAITREWKAGDKIDIELPMKIQVVRADEKVKADRGQIALRYGPLIYSVETTDQPKLDLQPDLQSLTTEWRGDLLGGVMTIKGKWTDGSPLLAIPYYARENRGAARSQVWLKE